MPWLNLHMKSQREKGFFSLKILLFFLQYEQRCMEEFCVQMALTLQPILAIFNMHAKPSSLDHASWRRQCSMFLFLHLSSASLLVRKPYALNNCTSLSLVPRIRNYRRREKPFRKNAFPTFSRLFLSRFNGRKVEAKSYPCFSTKILE